MLVTRNFPPLLGGMENVNQRLLRSLASTRPVLLCGPAGAAAHAPEASCSRESPLYPLPLFVVRTAWSALAMARRFRPALVLAGSGLTAPMTWLAARSIGARTAVYLHGLDIVAPSLVYRRVWLPFIRAMDTVLVNSGHTATLARNAGVDAARIHVLNPGTDVPTLVAGEGERFRRRFGLGGGPLLLSVGRLTRRKGLAEFVARSLPSIVAAVPGTQLVVIGEEAAHALHGSGPGEIQRIEAAAAQAGVAGSLRLVGRCGPDLLGAAFQAAQVHVFPVLALPGDVEGFGMVALESAAHGLRTVAFRVGGVEDAVCEPDSGRLVAADDYDAFAAAVVQYLRSDAPFAQREGARRFAQGKDWSAFGVRLRSILGP
jgi:phosphatidylinositol alpha-1,6-mannosyltransferase